MYNGEGMHVSGNGGMKEHFFGCISESCKEMRDGIHMREPGTKKRKRKEFGGQNQ
jgi:hypothetical protein